MEQTTNIIETVFNGKMKRVCGACSKDVTNITCWLTYKYCPFCGTRTITIIKE